MQNNNLLTFDPSIQFVYCFLFTMRDKGWVEETRFGLGCVNLRLRQECEKSKVVFF